MPPDQQSQSLPDTLHLLQVSWSNLELTVALIAGTVAWVAALAMPSQVIGPLGNGPTGLAPTVYQLACLAVPVVGVGGVALSGGNESQANCSSRWVASAPALLL